MTAPTGARPGRNEPCHCGSGRKYKHCCLDADEKQAAAVMAQAEADHAAKPPDGAPVTSQRTAKHQTSQPWKGTESRGFIPRPRTPRKVGGG